MLLSTSCWQTSLADKKLITSWVLAGEYLTTLQAATILVAMASGKNNGQLNFWRKLLGDLQVKRETH